MFKFKSLFAKVPLPEKNTESKELPNPLVSSLTQEIKNLPVVSDYTAALKSSLEPALTAWQEDNDAPNELVILSNPVEPLFKIIRDSIKNYELPDGWKIRLLARSNRPEKFLNISQILRNDLGIDSDKDFKENTADVKEVVVIPSLELCFLRQIYGLDGIEYLRDLIFKDNSRFWLIGCNNLAWEYLDYVYNLCAYFRTTVTLPGLDGSQIQESLMPILSNVNAELNWETESPEEKDAKLKTYFDRLADIAQGSISVAAELWWRSLSCLPETEESSETSSEASPETDNSANKTVVKLDRIKLPDLPDLTGQDRYLLFSLLLHHKMTLAHIALSLGDSESRIQFELQKLLTTGIITRERRYFQINPAYYLRLQTHLKNNNFITGY